jgi:hypothetical protein
VLLTKTDLHTPSAFGDAVIKGSLPNSGKLPFFTSVYYLRRAAVSLTRLPNSRAVSKSPGSISSGLESDGDCAIAPLNDPT